MCTLADCRPVFRPTFRLEFFVGPAPKRLFSEIVSKFLRFLKNGRIGPSGIRKSVKLEFRFRGTGIPRNRSFKNCGSGQPRQPERPSRAHPLVAWSRPKDGPTRKRPRVRFRDLRQGRRRWFKEDGNDCKRPPSPSKGFGGLEWNLPKEVKAQKRRPGLPWSPNTPLHGPPQEKSEGEEGFENSLPVGQDRWAPGMD